MRKFFIFIFLVSFICGAYLMKQYLSSNGVFLSVPKKIKIKNLDENKFLIGDKELRVWIARSEAEMAQGLSGTESLSDEEGLLFDFRDSPNKNPAFWMKDMLIDLDLVWIADGKVIGVSENVRAPKGAKVSLSELPQYYPPSSVDFVLEVNAGFAKRFGVGTGTVVGLGEEAK